MLLQVEMNSNEVLRGLPFFPCLPQSVDPLRQHPGHQGERPAAAGEAQQRLEEGVQIGRAHV